MYCNRCGAEFGPGESACFNCGEPRPVREKTIEKNTFMNGSRLQDNYIPLLWELLTLYVFVNLIAYLIVPSSSSSLAADNLFSDLSSLANSLSTGLNFHLLRSTLGTMYSRMPAVCKAGTLINAAGSLLYAVLLLLSAWRIFKKAGMSGWKSLIPIYNIYCAFQIVMGSGWYSLMVLVYCFALLLPLLTGTFSGSFQFAAMYTGIISIAALVFVIWFAHKAAVLYHHGWGYTIGLLFFTNLFIMFLGFGGGIVEGEEEADKKRNDFYGKDFKGTLPSGSDEMDQKQTAASPEEQILELPGTARCPACKEPVDPDWKFCRHCGAQLLE